MHLTGVWRLLNLFNEAWGNNHCVKLAWMLLNLFNVAWGNNQHNNNAVMEQRKWLPTHRQSVLKKTEEPEWAHRKTNIRH